MSWQDPDDEDTTPWDQAMFRAPFRERLPDGTLGMEYMPISCKTGRAVTHDQAQRDYSECHEAINSGGLWSHEIEALSRPATLRGRERLRVERYDHEAVTAYVDRHVSELPKRELEAYCLFYDQRRSYQEAARIMGVAISTARELVRRLRRKSGS